MTAPEATPNPHRIHQGLVAEELVCAAVQRHLGARPLRLLPRATKAPRVVFEAPLRGRPAVIFKAEVDTHGDDAIVLEAWAMDRARDAGVPVPRVLALDASGSAFPGRYAIFEKADGAPVPPVWRPRAHDEAALDPAALRGVFRAAGAALRRLHAVPVAGYGRLDDRRFLRTGEVRGRAASWREVAFDPALASVDYLGSRGVIAVEAADRMRAAVASRRDALAVCEGPRLLHGDFASKHLFVDEQTGGLTAVIDFGDREAGDPALDVANVLLWEDEERLGWLRAGYGDVERSFWARVRAYALADALRLAHARLREGRTADAAPVIARLPAFVAD